MPRRNNPDGGQKPRGRARAAGAAERPTDALPEQQELLPLPTDSTIEYIRVEKQAISMGVFSALSKKKAKTTPLEKKVVKLSFYDQHSGRRMDGSVTIMAGREETLPTTADLDKYMALMEIAERQRQSDPDGILRNPVRFDSSELLRRVGIDPTATANRDEIWRFLVRLNGVTIRSSIGIYHHKRKSWVDVVGGIIQHAVRQGQELEDGTIAEQNSVSFTDWQLENFNSHHRLPINRRTYFLLRRDIAKALYPHLQIWLYASEGSGYFVKDYEDLANLLSITPQPKLAHIRGQLKHSLDELVAIGMLARWEIAEAKKRTGKNKPSYNVYFYPGDGYKLDRETLARRREFALGTSDVATLPTQLPLPGGPAEADAIAEAFQERGLDASLVSDLLSRISPERFADLRRMVALHDFKMKRGELTNGPGWLRGVLARIAEGKAAYALPPKLAAELSAKLPASDGAHAPSSDSPAPPAAPRPGASRAKTLWARIVDEFTSGGAGLVGSQRSVLARDWLEPARAAGLSRGELQVLVPNSTFVQFLTANPLHEEIQTLAARHDVRVRFEVSQ